MDDEVKKSSFLVYYDNEVIVLRLPDDEAGKLFKSLFPYGKERIKPDFDANPALAMAFDILSMAIDRDKEKYERRCEKNRENGRKGGRPRKDIEKTEKSERLFSKPKKADKDRDRDNDNDNDNDNISIICPESEESAPNPSGILLILNDKTFYDVPLNKIALWKETYPAVDVEQQLKRIHAWLDSNPARRKTRRGIERFIDSWLSREQDEGGVYKKITARGKKNNFNDFPQNEYDFNQLEKDLLGE